MDAISLLRSHRVLKKRGSMLRHLLFALSIAALAFATLAIATEALPPTPDADLAKPPSDARMWTISSGNGASIHGHTHDSFDYVVNGVRVLCNPRGYAKDGVNENALFDAGLTVEVG